MALWPKMFLSLDSWGVAPGYGEVRPSAKKQGELTHYPLSFPALPRNQARSLGRPRVSAGDSPRQEDNKWFPTSIPLCSLYPLWCKIRAANQNVKIGGLRRKFQL